MAQMLPVRLQKAPLVNAIFEVRFQSSVPASQIIPGLFFTALEHESVKLDHLPAAQLPALIREQDPNLKYVAVSKLTWGCLQINFGDHSISVECSIEYPGWMEFKKGILRVLEILVGIRFIERVERYSMKYTNIVELPDITAKATAANVKIIVAEQDVAGEEFQIRIERQIGEILNIIQMATTAKAIYGTTEKNGLLIDVDSIFNVAVSEPVTVNMLMKSIDAKLDEIHTMNKKLFFSCLVDKAIADMEPVYE